VVRGSTRAQRTVTPAEAAAWHPRQRDEVSPGS